MSPLRQLTLPDMNVHLPICPGCKREVQFLGEFSPGEKYWLCKECTLKHPAPDVFVLHDNRIGAGLRQEIEFDRERGLYHSMVNSLAELKRGCVYTLDDWTLERGLPCEWDKEACYIDCPRCLRKMQYATRLYHAAAKVAAERNSDFETQLAHANRYTIMMANLPFARNLEFPLCYRCGQVHDNRYEQLNTIATHCQHCEDLNAVESFWRCKGIFVNDDDETILDRIQRSHPGLFERGVLPDMWFRLRRGDS